MTENAIQSMSVPKRCYFAHLRREGGDTYGPRTYSWYEVEVPSENADEAREFLSKSENARVRSDVEYSNPIILKRWKVVLTMSSGEQIEMKSEPQHR